MESVERMPPVAIAKLPGSRSDTGPLKRTLPASVAESNPPFMKESATRCPPPEAIPSEAVGAVPMIGSELPPAAFTTLPDWAMASVRSVERGWASGP